MNLERHFSPKDQKVIVRYLNFQKHEPKEIYEMITAACGLHAADYQIVKNWLEKMNGGGGDGDDDEDDASPERETVERLVEQSSKSDPEAVKRIEELVTRDKRLHIEKIIEMSLTSDELAYDIVHDDLGLKKICERWVPRLWTPEQRSYRVQVAKQLVYRFDDEGDEFLKGIVVGDDSFIHYYTPSTAPAVTQCETPKSKYVPEIEEIAVRFVVFYDSYGILCLEKVPQDTVVNPEYYSDFLRNKLIPAIAEKRKDTDIKKLSLIHGNNPIHNSLIVQKTLEDIELESLPCPPSSPDLEPFDYFLFNYLKNHMNKETFHSSEEIHKSILRQLESLNVEDYEKSIKKLVERWETILDSRGLYLH